MTLRTILAAGAIVCAWEFSGRNLASATTEAVADLVASVRVNYEGTLCAGDGARLQGRHRLTFGLFRGGSASEADSGTLLYGETVEAEVKEGCAAHTLGTGTPTFGELSFSTLSAAAETGDSNQELWLQVTVGDEQRVVLPRTRVAASDYMRKSDLDTAIQSAVRMAQIIKAAGTGYLSFIGGGFNQDASGGVSFIGGGSDNHATFWAAAVGGGAFNWATGAYSVVGGGLANAALHNRAAVLGGEDNFAEGYASAVGGGANNRAAGLASAIPGGQSNSAAGSWSFAAGRRAKSNAQGTFTWADSQDADYVNSTQNSVKMRAQNGMTLNASTNEPGMKVHNNGNGLAGEFFSLGDANGLHVSANYTGIIVSGTEGNGVTAYSGAGPFSVPPLGVGVYGAASTGSSPGVQGVGRGENGRGVVGQANNGAGAIGVFGSSTEGYAGWFSGKVHTSENLHVNGTLSKAAGTFKIDHPLDPENKYLSHSFVESPDMKNFYDGTVVLDANGEAVVELPEWFEALNKDFRYQLTAIGGASPTLHVAEEIDNNRFRIAGGNAGLKVSWLVTGVRKDAYAEAHRVQVEEEKPASERGSYLHPAEHGQPESKGLDAQNQKL